MTTWGPTQLYVFSTSPPPMFLRPARRNDAALVIHVVIGLVVFVLTAILGSQNGLGGLIFFGLIFFIVMSAFGWIHSRHPKLGQAIGWAGVAYVAYRGITHDHHDAAGPHS